ncbi:MAG TPA: YtxH domain-containing protein [Rubrobacter sp.]|nr:YtxH domain-containing protein [Rubrobacter sp.]
MDKQRLRTFVLGGAVGALVGILLAPRSGRELRGSLANRAGEARERGRETYFEAQEQMRERLAEVREGSRQQPDIVDPGEPAAKETTTGTRRPYLRDVSRDEVAAEETPGPDAERSEELRRKVRETRERLRGRKDQGQER